MDASASDVSVALAGESLWLCGEGAMYWPRRRTALVADSHLGKAASFRAAGIPVPRGPSASTLARLTTLIERTGADRLVVLGDLMHAADSLTDSTLTALCDWRARHAEVSIDLVPGNHDRSAGALPPELQINRHEAEVQEPPFVLAHHPGEDPRGYVLAGHVHPAVRLTDAGASFRLPCFHITKRYAVLPALGAFTGMHVVEPNGSDWLYPIIEGQVISPAADRPG